MQTVTLGDRIREARGKLTQDELAERIRRKKPALKLTGVRISRYERDVQSPGLSVLIAIADETGKPLDFFRVSDSGGGDESGDEADEEDSEAMTRAAYHLDRAGQYALADDLRRRARKAAMKSKQADRTRERVGV